MNPAAAGAFEILVSRGVGHLFGIEALPFIFDFYPHGRGIDLPGDPHRFLGIEPVPVFDRVDLASSSARRIPNRS